MARGAHGDRDVDGVLARAGGADREGLLARQAVVADLDPPGPVRRDADAGRLRRSRDGLAGSRHHARYWPTSARNPSSVSVNHAGRSRLGRCATPGRSTAALRARRHQHIGRGRRLREVKLADDGEQRHPDVRKPSGGRRIERMGSP